MLNVRGLSFAAVAVGALLLAAGAGLSTRQDTQAAVTTLDIQLSGAEEVPPVSGPGSAVAHVSFDDVTLEFKYTVTVFGLSNDQITASHLHRGAAGVSGPVAYPLVTASGASGGSLVFQGSFKVAAGDVESLKAGGFYLNVHSVANPAGFARGQVYLNPADAVRGSVLGTIAAWNQKNVSRFLRGFTPEGIRDLLGEDPATISEGLDEFIGSDPVALVSLSDVKVSGGTATGDLTLSVGASFERYLASFVFDGVIWKIGASTRAAVPIPAGTTAVSMSLQEFAFVYDKSAVTSGNFAISYRNAGRQDHEIVLVKVASSDPLLKILQQADPESEEPPEGIELIGVAAPIEPGESGNLVLTKALGTGRYAFLCFFPDTSDPEETPHAFKGMISEFNVGGGAAGSIRPPSTGDGGLAGTSSQQIWALFGLGAVLALGGVGTLALARRRGA